MRVLIAHDGTDSSNAILRDLHYAGLPMHASVRILSVAALHAPALAGEAVAYSNPGTAFSRSFTAAHEQLVETDWEMSRIRTNVSRHFPEWFVETEVSDGNADEAILESANTWGADLILMGSHGRTGLKRMLLGSVSLRVAEEAQCSVRIVHPRHTHPERPLNLLLTLDGSSHSEDVIAALAERSFPRNTRVHILHIIEPTLRFNDRASIAMQRLLDQSSYIEGEKAHQMLDYFESEVRQLFPRIESQIRYGSASTEILRYADQHDIDAIFLGARGKAGRTFGSVTRSIIEQAETAIEVIR